MNDEGELDKLAHITNNSVQKKHPDYATLKDSSIWSMRDLEVNLRSIHFIIIIDLPKNEIKCD